VEKKTVCFKRHLCFDTVDSARKARDPGSPPPADEHVEGEDSTRNHESEQAAEAPEAHEPAIGPAESSDGESHEGGNTETGPMAVDDELRDASGEKDEEDKVGTSRHMGKGLVRHWRVCADLLRKGLLTNGSRESAIGCLVVVRYLMMCE
jgi:hypothetical protein